MLLRIVGEYGPWYKVNIEGTFIAVENPCTHLVFYKSIYGVQHAKKDFRTFA